MALVCVRSSLRPPLSRPRPRAAGNGGTVVADAGVPLPPGYVIGAEDVLSIVFWRDKDMSADVVVRPDGKDLAAAAERHPGGRTHARSAAREHHARRRPSSCRSRMRRSWSRRSTAGRCTSPAWSSRADRFRSSGDMTVLQAIALAGGLQEYADAKNIVIIRKEDGKRAVLQVQLQGRREAEERRAEHRAEARRHGRRAVADSSRAYREHQESRPARLQPVAARQGACRRADGGVADA